MENQIDLTNDHTVEQLDLRDLLPCEIVLIGGGEVVIIGI